MDDISLFAKKEKELETLMQAVRIYNDEIEMEYGKEKCVMQIISSGKRWKAEGIELPNQEKNPNTRRKRNLLVLGNIGSGHQQTSGDERKN